MNSRQSRRDSTARTSTGSVATSILARASAVRSRYPFSTSASAPFVGRGACPSWATWARSWHAHRAAFPRPHDETTRRIQHSVNPPFNPFVRSNYNKFDVDLFKDRSPWYWADNIDVPTFLFETWQDEQVGSRATELIERFDEELEWRFLGTNGDHGGHGDYYGSHVMPKIDEFLSFYLKGETPAGYQGGTVTTTREVPCPDPTPTPTPSPTKTKKPKGKPSPAPSPSPAARRPASRPASRRSRPKGPST